MAQASAAIFRRPKAKALRAQRVTERKAYDASFSYEDDEKKKAEAEAAKAAARGVEASAAAAQGKDRRDKRH